MSDTFFETIFWIISINRNHCTHLPFARILTEMVKRSLVQSIAAHTFHSSSLRRNLYCSFHSESPWQIILVVKGTNIEQVLNKWGLKIFHLTSKEVWSCVGDFLFRSSFHLSKIANNILNLDSFWKTYSLKTCLVALLTSTYYTRISDGF